MHFDDIGLAFPEAATSYCADSSSLVNTAPCASSPLPTKPLYVTAVSAPVATGTTAGGTSPTVLQYGSSPWAVNQWDGYYLTYTSGFASGQSELITSNTANTITTSVPFSPAPTMPAETISP